MKIRLLLLAWALLAPTGSGAAELWSLQAPRPSPLPAVKDEAWPRSGIDRFILAGLEARGLAPVAAASPETLIRRTYFNLTGLPPKPEDVAAFTADPSPQAFANLVDRLLDSPQFGERWGRHWLDVARYAESNGRDQDAAYPDAWRYRDYVIDAFNAGVPYDRFIHEQLAGDLLPAANDAERDRLTVATGFLAIGGKLLFEADPERFFLELADEQIQTTTVAFLGLTVGCARCHDHKFDPISAKDYYSLASIFRSTEPRLGLNYSFPNRPESPAVILHSTKPEDLAAYKAYQDRYNQAQRDSNMLRTEYRRLPVAEQGSEAARELLLRADEAMKKFMAMRSEKAPPRPGFAMAVADRAQPIDVRVLEGGEIDSPGQPAPRGFLSALPAGPEIPAEASGRLQLAQWLTSPSHPLTARVMVNRVWQQLFGRGLVETADNFGVTGAPPSHPELLDHLAIRFRENGWRVKDLIREIALSRTYGLGNEPHSGNLEKDAANVYLWRMNRRPLDAEALRDAILANAGRLDTQRPANPALYERSSNVNEGALFATHRSVYMPIGRANMTSFQRTFDFAEPSSCVGKRNETTVPAQALFFMNNFFVAYQSDQLARELEKIQETPPQRIDRVFKLILGRPPGNEEEAATLAFLNDLESQPRRRGQAWSLICQALFSSADFRYLP